MSYDLIVYRTPPGRDPEEVFEQEMEATQTYIDQQVARYQSEGR